MRDRSAALRSSVISKTSSLLYQHINLMMTGLDLPALEGKRWHASISHSSIGFSATVFIISLQVFSRFTSRMSFGRPWISTLFLLDRYCWSQSPTSTSYNLSWMSCTSSSSNLILSTSFLFRESIFLLIWIVIVSSIEALTDKYTLATNEFPFK